MSIERMAIVLNHSKAKGTDKVVLLGIANHDGDGGAWPSVKTLSRYANVARSTVQEALVRLEASGEIRRHLNAGGTHDTDPYMRPNRYDILVVCPATCDRTPNHQVSDLPKAPADLWTNPARPTGPGGDDGAGGARPTGRGPARPTGHEPSLEPTVPNKGSASVTTGGVTPPCTVCGAADLVTCQRRQAKCRATDRHTYTAAQR